MEKQVPLEEAEAGDIVIFGSYEQDNDMENGSEPNAWQAAGDNRWASKRFFLAIPFGMNYHKNNGDCNYAVLGI